jgi:mRNA capping enzyme, C-terminal domain
LTKILEMYTKDSERMISELISNSVLCDNSLQHTQIRNNLAMIFEKKLKKMKGNWKLFRRRADKNTPNAFATAANVFKCIFENITLADVETAISKINYQQVHMYQMQQQQQQQENFKRHNENELEDETMTKKVRNY